MSSAKGLVVRSCEKECLTPTEGTSTGSIPDWLEGTLLRNGVGVTRFGPDQFEHAFDGMALLHQFQIRSGRVTYQNRFINSDCYQRNAKANRIIVGTFGTAAHPDPCATLFQRWSSAFTSEIADNPNVNTIMIGDGIYVADEVPYIYRIDPQTLETKERLDLNSIFSVNTCTAHPHYDPDGAVFNIGTSFGFGKSAYCIVHFPAKGPDTVASGKVLCRIPFSKTLYPSYYHSFGMSQNYIIFVEQCLTISIPTISMSFLIKRPFENTLKWNPGQLTKFHIVNRSTGELLKTNLVAAPFVVFHHANAFEWDDGKEIVVDLVGYEDGDMVKSLYYKHMISSGFDPQEMLTMNASKTYRFVLPIGQPTEEQVDSGSNLSTFSGCQATATARLDGSIFCVPDNLTPGLRTFEMPQFNYSSVCGKEYKYLYGVGKVDEKAGVVKVDVAAKSHVMWSSPGFIASEPVFVARPGASQEDDGVLLSSLLSQDDEKKVSLVVLDAKSMRELGRTSFVVPGSIPPDFHGNFYKL